MFADDTTLIQVRSFRDSNRLKGNCLKNMHLLNLVMDQIHVESVDKFTLLGLTIDNTCLVHKMYTK